AGDRVPTELAERDDEAHARERGQLAVEEGTTGVALGGRRLVGRRGALHGGGDEAAVEGQAVAALHARRLIGVAGAVQRGEQEVAGAVTREHPSRAVAAV